MRPGGGPLRAGDLGRLVQGDVSVLEGVFQRGRPPPTLLVAIVSWALPTEVPVTRARLAASSILRARAGRDPEGGETLGAGVRAQPLYRPCCGGTGAPDRTYLESPRPWRPVCSRPPDGKRSDSRQASSGAMRSR
jgi:hypothetical protein